MGQIRELLEPPCNESSVYHQSVQSFACMGYSLARAYLSAIGGNHGADMVAPAGLAWQIVRGVEHIPSDCKALIDKEYDEPLPLDLPMQVEGASMPDLMLFLLGKLNTSSAFKIDKHPNIVGQYLNALTLYATLFGESPEGAAGPSCSPSVPPRCMRYAQGISEPGEASISKQILLNLQKAAWGSVIQCGQQCGIDSRVTKVVYQ